MTTAAESVSALGLRVCEACESSLVRGEGLCLLCLRKDAEYEAQFRAQQRYESTRVQMGLALDHTSGRFLRWLLRQPMVVVAGWLAFCAIGFATAVVGMLNR